MNAFARKLKDGMERARIAKLWGRRIDASGKSRAEFCEKYKLDDSQLSRWINGKNGPEWTSIEVIEAALKKEGV